MSAEPRNWVHNWTAPPGSMPAEEWEALAIRFRSEVGIVPYNVWKNLTTESRDWVGGLVQERAQFILANVSTIVPVNLTATSGCVAFENAVTVSRDTAYLLRLVDILRRTNSTKELP
jgi:hypothetical protein